MGVAGCPDKTLEGDSTEFAASKQEVRLNSQWKKKLLQLLDIKSLS